MVRKLPWLCDLDKMRLCSNQRKSKDGSFQLNYKKGKENSERNNKRYQNSYKWDWIDRRGSNGINGPPTN